MGGQQPGDINYIIISLSSGEEIEFPASDFMENHAVPSASEYYVQYTVQANLTSLGIPNLSLVLPKSAEVNDGSLPLDPPPDINDPDMDPPDVTLEREDNVEEVERHPDIEAWIGFADDSWPTSSQHCFFRGEISLVRRSRRRVHVQDGP